MADVQQLLVLHSEELKRLERRLQVRIQIQHDFTIKLLSF
jgi:hypothetical protein